MEIRQRVEELERQNLSPYASLSSKAQRDREEEPDEIRTAFQRDRDRIIHSKCFRRLKHKTQVYIAPGDHYRTRMTHTLEVGQIGRTICRALRLNEDLVEAIAMGHDVGHTPFGHVGEMALNKMVGHFHHNEQSLRIVEKLERDGKGLNLTKEVRDGILCHTGPQLPSTLEGKIVRTADRIAYLCHDFDDAQRAGMLTLETVPSDLLMALGRTPSEMITTMVKDMIKESWEQDDIKMSAEVTEAMNAFRRFMFDHVYIGEAMIPERKKGMHVVEHLFNHFVVHPEELRGEMPSGHAICAIDDIVDYVAGLTDQYAIKLFKEIYIPKLWDN